MASTGERLPPICLMGPTASGKTDVALALARRFPRVALISVDSAMVYRHMDVGTGKPSATVLAEIPHRLIDIRDPRDPYSAGQFAVDAAAAVDELRAAGRLPLLVGGTLLYFRSLLGGLSPLPTANDQVRAAIEAEAATRGWPALHAELAAADPDAAERIGPNDRQRIQRALEVFRLTGTPLSVLQKARPGTGQPALRIALLPADRTDLHRRIARRFDAMLAAGFLEEVARLRALPGMHAGQPALRAVGYRQLWAHLEGEASLAEAREQGLAATRQLARRQLTWLRAEALDHRVEVPPDAEVAAVADAVAERLRSAGYAGALSPPSR